MIPWLEKSGFSSKRILLYLVCFLLLVCTAAAYWDIDKCGFLKFDDQEYVYENNNVVTGLSAGHLKWAFTTFCAANWHPLTWMSHMVDCQVFGLKPAGHHLTSLVFHILNTLLLFIVLKSMTGALWRSALVAALFSLHPMHVESVAWISERKDVVCTFFMLLTLFSYNLYVTGKKNIHYFAALFLFALGLMAKPMIVTLPFVLLLLDVWPLKRFSVMSGIDATGNSVQNPSKPTSLFLEKIPFFFLSFASCIITIIAQRNSGAVMDLVKFPAGVRCANAALSYVEYVKKIFWPADLSFFYPAPANMPVAGKLIAAIVVLLLITIIALLFMKKRPSLFVGWFWFLGTLAPVIGIVQVGNQAMADRYTYIPFIGLGISIAWLVADVAGKNRLRRTIVITGLIAVLVLVTFQTRKQVACWKSNESLADHALMVTRDNYLAYSMKGFCLLQRNKPDEAKQCHLKALSLFPSLEVSRINVGYIDLLQGNNRDAIAVLNVLLAQDSLQVQANHMCGQAYMALDELPHAVDCFSRVLKTAPDYVPALYNMGLLCERKKDYTEATRYFLKVLSLKVNDSSAIDQLRMCRASQKR